MAKGGRMIVKKSRRGIGKLNGEESDDDEYIAEEEEEGESESYEESLASSSDSGEDQAEFGGNLAELSGSDHNFDEDESDFEFDDSEFEPEEEEEVELKRSNKGRKKSVKNRKKSVKNQRKSRRKISDSEEEEQEEEEFERKRVPDLDQEEEFDLDPPPPPLEEKKNKKARSKRRNKSDEESDYEEEAELELEEEEEEEEEEEDFDLDEDEDFSPDEDEEEFLSIRKRKIGLKRVKNRRSPIKKRRKKSRVLRRNKTSVTRNKKENKNKKKRRRTKKKNSVKEPSTKRRRRIEEEEEELMDDDFLDDDDEFVIEEKTEPRKKSSITKSRKRKPGSDSETSEFEFRTSDEEESEEEIQQEFFQVQTQTRPKRRKKHRFGSGSSSDDSDFVLYDSDPDPPALKPVRERKRKAGKGKGKEKEREREEKEDSGRKVCGICLSEEQKRTTPGVLDCCAHFFCFACIMEWSKVESRCPVCKRRFETITKASSSDSDDLAYGAPSKVIKVPKRDQVYQPSEEDLRGMLDPYENVVCMECQQGGDDNLMLLCDICDSSAHTYCVGLGHFVPEGNWYCDCCRSAGIGPSHPVNVPFQSPNIPFQTPSTPFQTPSTPFQFQPAPHFEPAPAVVNNLSEMEAPVSGVAVGEPSSVAGGVAGLEIDLNAPPVEEELNQSQVGPSQSQSQVASPGAGGAGGAATLSGRRAIRQRIRILLSSSRAMQIVVRRNGEGGSGSAGESNNHAPVASSRFGPGGTGTDLNRAKERVWSVVKTHLRNLCLNSPLEHDEFKSIGRAATHAVLAACGIRVESRNPNSGSGSIQPPHNCGHVIRTQDESSLISDVCSPCFSSFVRDVVADILNSSK